MNHPPKKFGEHHRLKRSGWLRAAVLGANDGILSTAGIVSGMAASTAAPDAVFLAGLAGLLAGALSMAAGEYVSVSSQSDIEEADLAMENRELERHPDKEREELAQIYISRGLTPDLAREVSRQLTAHDALAAHAHDELGISTALKARPVQAGLASAASFSLGGILPLLIVMLAPANILLPVVIATALATLVVLGTLGALLSGTSPLKPTLRVFFWGTLALAVTTLVGMTFKIGS